MTDLRKKLIAYKQTLENNQKDVLLGRTICKLAGVTFGGRQKHIRLVKDDTPMKLYRDAENIHDLYAVGVVALIDEEWCDLGYIPKEINREVCSIIDKNNSLEVKLWRKTGGENDFHYGITVVLQKTTEKEF